VSSDPIRLHLGCGEVYLPGYVNVDFPPHAHTVQSEAVVDLYADLKSLQYPPESVAEIRLHHVFEHFTRGTAIGLVIGWYGWLVEGGSLTIETPDFERMVKAFRRAKTAKGRGLALRHIFGSHEADWAVHCDGWYPEKFERVLSALGYCDLQVEQSKWRGTHNVTAVARKRRPFANREEQLAAAERLLRESLVDDSPSERRQLQTWLDDAASCAS
jgi:predicted SAM-dependent methyltransferase